ncbi:MAG: hypothetical protein JXL80_09190 [Planctomycetes bacterium]|nr:hypothetical protein [Planctomycetota bacterium]
MDQTMLARWQAAETPFDGAALWSNTDLTRDQLAKAVSCMVSFVASRIGLAERLHVIEDWHNHDGYVTNPKEVVSALFVREVGRADSEWFRLMDTFVYWGVYDETMRFYLRFGMGDEEAAGYFDLSTGSEIVAQLATELTETLGIPVEVEPAKELFDRTYAG